MPAPDESAEDPADVAAGRHRTPTPRRPLWMVLGVVVLVALVVGGTWLAVHDGDPPPIAGDLGPALPAFGPTTDQPTSTGPSAMSPTNRTQPTAATATVAATGAATATVAARPPVAPATTTNPPPVSPPASATPTPVYVAPRTGTIVGASGKCVDDNSNWSVEGNPIQVWECNRTQAQQWSYGTDATLQVHNKCIRPAGDAPASGAVVQLRACATAYQGWLFRSDATLFNPASGLCLTDPGVLIDGRPQLTVTTCRGTANQRWTLP